MSILLALAVGWIAAAIVMATLWALQRRTGDAGIVDVAWAAGVGILASWFAWIAEGAPERRWIIAILAGIWSLRLTAYLFQRVLRMPEDGRYRELRDDWGDRADLNLFWFFQIQAFWSVLFAAPMFLAARNAEPLGWLDVAGVLVWVAALSGEWVADRQLGGFRSDPRNKGAVCRDGLWRYTRHPNYFFEWIHWFSYVLIGWSGPMGWLTLSGPALMLLFLFKITGIPPTEKHALASRGQAYRDYQQVTSVFFPWPPKEKTT